MSELTNSEEVLREVIWYGAHRYDDKPAQFWNRMRIAAEALGDAEAASIFEAYCENGCPLTNEHAQAARILAALREPNEGTLMAVLTAIYTRATLTDIIRAAVIAAEQEVGS